MFIENNGFREYMNSLNADVLSSKQGLQRYVNVRDQELSELSASGPPSSTLFYSLSNSLTERFDWTALSTDR